MLTLQVGVSTWRIALAPDALALLIGADALGEPDRAAFNEEALERLMANVRDKAVRLSWYGGGTMTIDKAELSLPAPPLLRDVEGRVVPRKPWFRLIGFTLLPDAPIV
jgi:hypothetical protein